MDIEAQKRQAAALAVEWVRPGMRLGLGTGSTAKHFVELLAERVRGGLNVVGVPTSETTRADAQRLGVPLTTLDDIVDSSHSFNGFGPSIGAEVRRPILDGGFSLYASGRGSILFGKSSQLATNINNNVVTNFGSYANWDVVPTLETELGILWQRDTDRGRMFLDAGVVGIAFFGAGNADFTSSDFQNTILGEAVKAAVQQTSTEVIADKDKAVFLAAGAAGQAAIYTDHLHAVHIIRKVIVRVGSYTNYLVLKLH
jgi:hypothetical protein